MNNRVALPTKTVALIILCLVAAKAFAQKVPIACQVEAAAGLNWENDRWVTSRYNSDVKFVLVLDGGTLALDSAAKALRASSANCRSVFGGRIECSDELGGRIEFSPITLRGTVAQLLGGTTEGMGSRDSISVMPFTCQRF